MWVASYGVMPQTYIRAVAGGRPDRHQPAAAAVSKACTRSRAGGLGQRRQRARAPGLHGRHLIRASTPLGRSERRPRDRRPLAARPRQPLAGAAAGRPGGRTPRPPARRAARPAGPGRSSRARRTAASSRSFSSAPAQPQSRVRSLWSVWKLTPWSTPNTRPPLPRMWPPLRSALLIKHVEDGQQPQVRHVGVDHRDRPVVGVQALHAREPALARAPRRWAPGRPARRSPSSSTSTQACSDPGPSGPSANTVTGTQSNPPIRDTSYAATSR